MYSKEEQLIAYIAKEKARVDVTSLMKLVYLIDLVNLKKIGKTITDFKYRRYNYGPFDERIYSNLESLSTRGVILPKLEFTSSASEYIVYEFNDSSDIEFDKLSDDDCKSVNEVLESVKGLGAKTLTQIAYKTKPMLKIKAKLGGREHYNEELDLYAE